MGRPMKHENAIKRAYERLERWLDDKNRKYLFRLIPHWQSWWADTAKCSVCRQKAHFYYKHKRDKDYQSINLCRNCEKEIFTRFDVKDDIPNDRCP